MNQTNDNKHYLRGKSSTFWAITSIGVVMAFFGVLVCGLIAGAGVITAMSYWRDESVAAAAPHPEPQADQTVQTKAKPEGASTEGESSTTDETLPEERPAGEVEAITGVEAGALPPKIGNPAANFTLMDLTGQTVSLSDFEGQPVILNFWATWCPPCEAEMPDIHQAYLEHQSAGLVVLAIDMAEHPDTVSSFVEYYELTFPILLDDTQDVGQHYGARALPTTYFIDRDGTISHVYFGQMDEAAIMIGLRKIMPELDTSGSQESD